MADFGTTPEWDSGTETCTRLDDGPLAMGARLRNIPRFGGRRTKLEFRLDRYEPQELVFVGRNRTVTATGVITLHPADERHTVVAYRAQLRFQGLARLATPIWRAEFERLAGVVALKLPQVSCPTCGFL
ncbi:SRPBCC family protein [Streptomyces sp. NPDC059819]|uniref:SRPBCC family protein n=1 Tax=Streptomyces sp. NPDC059819 TaxID=3346963 RepID=UPI003660311C